MTRHLFKSYFFYLAILSFGINLAFTFQLTYLSSIFKFLGAEAQQLSFLWLAPPVTGLIVQPLIGQISDDTVTPYGKRRPYIIGGGILVVFSFLLAPALSTLSSAVLLIWLLNASINCCLAMLRALTTDLSSQKERPKVFAFQAFLGGIGAAVGVGLPYLTDKFLLLVGHLPWLEIQKVKMPVNFQLAFFIAGIVMGLALFISIRKVKEVRSSISDKKRPKKFAFFFQHSIRTFTDLGKNLQRASFTFKKCCVLNSITWLALFIFWVYFVIVITQNFYPSSTVLDEHSVQSMRLLQKATLDSTRYLSVSQYVGIIYSLLLFFLLKHTEKMELIHGISLLIGGIGMFLIGFAHTPLMIYLAMVGIGILGGSLSILPFTIVSHILPPGKSGVYFGIFNIGITFSQIIGGLTLSPVYLYFFHGHAAYMMFFSGVLILISAILWLQEAYLSRKISLKNS